MKRYLYLTISLLFVAIGAWSESAPDPDRHLELQEVVVRPGKVKYSKKNNPAVEFVEKVMARRNMTDPRLNNDFYNHDLYERINLGVINFKADSAGALGFLREYMDTTALSARPVLNLFVKEKLSDVHYRRSPQKRREIVRLRSSHGFDDLIGDSESMLRVFEEFLKPVDLYDANDLTLLRQKFVSPLGKLATDFYKFYLTDTIADHERGDSLIVLSFVPHNPVMPSFNGRLYVVKGDSAMFIRRAELRMPKESNVNFIKEMAMVQEYDRAPDGSRLKTRDDVIIEMNYLGMDGYFTRQTAFNNHTFSEPRDPKTFDGAAEVVERLDLNASMHDFRPADVAHGSTHMNAMMERLRSNKVFYWGERILSTLTTDYVRPGGNNAPVAIGPIFSTYSHNGLEGSRLRLGGQTTGKLNPHWLFRGYSAYGFADKVWKYSGTAEYSFSPKKNHHQEFPVRSIAVSHSYDVDRLGQHYSAAGTLFNSLTFTSNNLMTYNRKTAVNFSWETDTRFSVTLNLEHNRQEQSRCVEFVDGSGRHYGHFQQTSATLELRWAPGELYYQSMNRRIPIPTEKPIIRLTHTFAPSGVFGTKWGVNKTEMSITKRWFASAWGHLDAYLGAGHVWSSTVFPWLLMPNSNLSYFYQLNAFSLLEAMEYVNDSYAELHLNYNANGALLNYIPGINRLKLRELFGFHAIWGQLSDKNNPQLHPDLLRFPPGAHARTMGNVPYMEANVGIGNIFRILSVQYVWRITHRHDATNLHGIRAFFTFSF